MYRSNPLRSGQASEVSKPTQTGQAMFIPNVCNKVTGVE